jgi:hypothetical protein
LLLAVSRDTAKIQRMFAWVSKALFQHRLRGRRRRELRLLLLAIFLGVIVCAAIAGLLYAINNQLPK